MAVYVVSLIAILAVAGLAYWRQNAAFTAVFAAYERMLDRRDREYDELASRAFYKENLPPAGIDMAEEYKERQELRRQRDTAEKRPHRIGLVESAQLSMEIDALRQKSQAN